jgi:hypothetical protein
MVPWGLGLGKRRELFRSRRTLRALPSPLYFFVGAYKDQCERASIKNASGGPKPAAFSLTHHGPTPPATLDPRMHGFQRADLFGQLAVEAVIGEPVSIS